MPLPTLYILGAAPPDDPLDCVGGAAPLLADAYGAIHKVGPGRALSVRSLRRLFDPQVDRVLYDLTAPGEQDRMLAMLGEAPGAVLLSNFRLAPAAGPLADLRSAWRYAAGEANLHPAATPGVLDSAEIIPGARILRRPAAAIAAVEKTYDLALTVAPGAIETAYSALLGLSRNTASLIVLAAARRDANDLTDIIDALRLTRARVRYIRSRRDVVTAACAVGGLIDAAAGDGLSDAAFTARCVGAPVLTLTDPEGSENKAAAFAATAPERDVAAARDFRAARTDRAFAKDLHALIEAGHHRARQAAAPV